jgi:two-component system response regulator DegU
MKILIVEDNPQMRRLIRRFVDDFSPEVYECADGAGALSAYTRYMPDWVLMDINLPHLNGLEATRQIIFDFPEAQILMVTNYDDERLRAAAVEAGARGYVLKENLLEVRQWLAAR